MKKAVLLFIVLFCCKVTLAQVNYYKLCVGLSGGANTYYGDLNKGKVLPLYQASFDYFITPYLTAGLDVQTGTISAGDSLSSHKRFFKNSYTSYVLNSKIQLGQVVSTDFSNFLYAIKGIYVGSGVGIIFSNQKEIIRTQIRRDGSVYTFPGKNKSLELVVPANIGINIDLPRDYWGYNRFIFNVNYSFNVTFGENIDGYNDPKGMFSNMYPDMLGIATVGIKYTFGPEGLF